MHVRGDVQVQAALILGVLHVFRVSRDVITKLGRQKQREIDSLLTPLIARTLCVPVVVLAIIVVFDETIQVHSTAYSSFLPLLYCRREVCSKVRAEKQGNCILRCILFGNPFSFFPAPFKSRHDLNARVLWRERRNV